MKLRTFVYADTLSGIMTNDTITDRLNKLLSECEITPENLIDIKVNIHPVYNIVMSEDTYIDSSARYNELERNADYTSTRYIVTIIYKTEE